jgi:hypothetical protein
MRKLWVCILVLSAGTVVPQSSHAYAKCEAASACGSCAYVAIYTYYASDGNAYYVTGSCCGCA